MNLKDKTYKSFSNFADYCRTGNSSNFKTLEVRDDRMHHYKRLVFNITNNTLKQAFPITYKLFSENQWDESVKDFFENHNAQEYRVWMMPIEFYHFLEEKKYAEKYKIPFLNDLLLLEWIEIEIHTMEDEIFPEVALEGDLWNDILVLNPEYRLIQLEYPVHTKITKGISEEDKNNYFLFAYRDFETQGVQFMNISVLFAYLIEQIEEKNNLQKIMDSFCKLSGNPPSDQMREEMESFIINLKAKKVILGFRI